MHKAHFALTRYASKKTGGHLLIHPVVGMTKPDDINAFTRIRCYKKIMSRYPKGSATLSLLPLAIRMGGPREAVWHAIIRKNYGCTHFIVGRDHSGPGKDRHGNLFYSPYEAQEMLAKYAPEIGITPIFSKQLVYVKNQDKFLPIDKLQKEDQVITMSGTEIRRRLKSGEEIPTWFSFPEVITELKRAFPPPEKKGLTLFFTGYSGSGKSALGKVLYQRLKDAQDRTVSFLDGDVIRTHLSKGLGFTKEDRSINVRRAGFVASEITKNRGIVICSLIAPYEADRKFNRELISANGDYIEIYLSTPLEVCEKRDVKGLYAKARRGEVKHFTGIDEIYEVPENPTLVFDTTDVGIDELVEEIISYLSEKGYINEIEKEKTA